MVFSDRTYSVLLLSASEVSNRAVLPLLPSSRFYPVTLVTDLRAAKDCAPCDLVIVNAPLPGGDSLSYCSGLSEASDSAILLLVPRDQLEHAEDRMLPYGVMTLGKPLSSGLLTQSLRALCSMRERLRSREQKQQTVEQHDGGRSPPVYQPTCHAAETAKTRDRRKHHPHLFPVNGIGCGFLHAGRGGSPE